MNTASFPGPELTIRFFDSLLQCIHPDRVQTLTAGSVALPPSLTSLDAVRVQWQVSTTTDDEVPAILWQIGLGDAHYFNRIITMAGLVLSAVRWRSNGKSDELHQLCQTYGVELIRSVLQRPLIESACPPAELSVYDCGIVALRDFSQKLAPKFWSCLKLRFEPRIDNPQIWQVPSFALQTSFWEEMSALAESEPE